MTDPWIMSKGEEERYIELRQVWDEIEELGLGQGLTWEASQKIAIEIFKDFRDCEDMEKDYKVVNLTYKMYRVRPKFRLEEV